MRGRPAVGRIVHHKMKKGYGDLHVFFLLPSTMRGKYVCVSLARNTKKGIEEKGRFPEHGGRRLLANFHVRQQVQDGFKTQCGHLRTGSNDKKVDAN